MKNFSQRYTYLHNNKTELPFTIGALIQPGKDKSFGYNNQDALSISVDKNYIIGVVCDGCAGTYDTPYNTSSLNEVGAHAISTTIVNAAEKFIKEYENKECSFDDLLMKVDRYLFAQLRKFIRLFSDGKESDYSYYAYNVMCATLVGVIITNKEWAIFHVGDGICGYNSSISDLQMYEGEYYNKYILKKRHPKKRIFRIFEKGETKDLNNIIIGTDGMIDFLRNNNDGKNEFVPEIINFMECEDYWDYSQGLSTDMNFTREFRMRVMRSFEGRCPYRLYQGHDDRAFIAIRRIKQIV